MPISLLRIANFRNILTAELTSLSQGLNIIYGNNGSGKTSLLEAIYYLGSGRSLRGSAATRLIHHQADKFSVFSQLVIDDDRLVPLGVERSIQGTSRLRLAEKSVATLAELARFLPLRVINSHSYHLFESGPIFRRKYLDWGLFYQSEAFLTCWRRFERILKQRNAALREKRSKQEIGSWTAELVKQGLELDCFRQAYTEALTPVFTEIAAELIPIADLKIIYESGWHLNQDYSTVLANNYCEDLRLGYTQYGPHRADLDITTQRISVRHILSRGQQKLLICAMILAQGMLLVKWAKTGLIYLIDDLPSELDLQSRRKLIALLAKQQTQIFITTIERETICDLIKSQSGIPVRVFHVEHGKVL